MTRRTFLDRLMAGGLIAWGAAIFAPVVSYVWPVQRSGPVTQSVSAGKAADFANWQGQTIAVGGQPVLVVRTAQGFRAFSAICTHLGCIVQWDAARHQITCPCHAGVFDINGRVLSGPPPRSLAEHDVSVVNGDVQVRSA